MHTTFVEWLTLAAAINVTKMKKMEKATRIIKLYHLQANSVCTPKATSSCSPRVTGHAVCPSNPSGYDVLKFGS